MLTRRIVILLLALVVACTNVASAPDKTGKHLANKVTTHKVKHLAEK
jgi:hypothetical protein